MGAGIVGRRTARGQTGRGRRRRGRLALVGAGLLLIPLLAFASTEDEAIRPRAVKPKAVTVPGNDVDSLAVWIAPEREDSLVLLTEKRGGAVMVFKADRRATFVGRFRAGRRPNGIAILQQARIGAIRQDLAFVTDRDGDVVRVYSMPDFREVGTFGEGVRQPMGIALYHRGDGAVFAFVVPKAGQGEAKVLRFRIGERGGRIVGAQDLAFGRELTVGQESVAVDPEREVVLVADESAGDIKVYGVDGQYRSTFGQGHFEGQVEGIVVAGCKGRGYVIASDQKAPTEFEVFDRVSLRHVGTVQGAAWRTDGLALTLADLPGYPRGLFVAQSDPDDTGGREAQFYRLDRLLKGTGSKLAKTLKKCR